MTAGYAKESWPSGTGPGRMTAGAAFPACWRGNGPGFLFPPDPFHQGMQGLRAAGDQGGGKKAIQDGDGRYPQPAGEKAEPGFGKGKPKANPEHEEEQQQGTAGRAGACCRHLLRRLGGAKVSSGHVEGKSCFQDREKRDEQVFDDPFENEGDDSDKDQIREELVQVIHGITPPENPCFSMDISPWELIFLQVIFSKDHCFPS